MKITFVAAALDLSGGSRVLATYARVLNSWGHSVCVVAPSQRNERFAWLFPRRPLAPQPASHFDSCGARIHLINADQIAAVDVPDADVIVATWWETAEWIGALPLRKGAKVYFIQHHEIHDYLPVPRVAATYRLPLRKVVVAQWLAKVMHAEYGDANVDVVPNCVDHQQFYAPLRGKQAVPTVGLSYAHAPWKRFGLAMDVLLRVSRSFAKFRVVCFGVRRPELVMPAFVDFFENPEQIAIRELYASCDVWLATSSSEGFNLPAMEAMACRTPVVSTRTGWPAEAIIAGVNGECVDVDDEDALVRAIENVLWSDESEWSRLSEGAFQTVRASSWEDSTSRLLSSFESAIRASSSEHDGKWQASPLSL